MEMKRPTKPPDEKMIEPIFMQTLKIKLLISQPGLYSGFVGNQALTAFQRYSVQF